MDYTKPRYATSVFSREKSWFGLLAALIFTCPAHGAGNASNGKSLAQGCVGCHGVQGYDNTYPTFHVPKLGGQSPDYLAAAVSAYQSGKRTHATMHANVAGLSRQDVEDIVAYFSSLEAKQ